MKVTQFHRDEKTGRIELHLQHDDSGNGTVTYWESDEELKAYASQDSRGIRHPRAKEVVLFLQAIGANLFDFIDIPAEKINAQFEIVPAKEPEVQEKK